jgi:Hypoxia induced protein conserved region
MTSIPLYASLIAVLAVGVVLVLGLGTMLKGTSPSRSQLYMRWRIGLQLIAIVLIMLTVALTRR